VLLLGLLRSVFRCVFVVAVVPEMAVTNKWIKECFYCVPFSFFSAVLDLMLWLDCCFGRVWHFLWWRGLLWTTQTLGRFSFFSAMSVVIA
jgi:hypothetical protein